MAARVYTICDESRYLIVKNVPALGCIDELVKLFGLYGTIEEYRLLDEEDCEPFTDIYWIKFAMLTNATFAKRKLDKYNFLGNLLEVSYAPRYESVSDTREKLEERKRMVLHRIRVNAGALGKSNAEIIKLPSKTSATGLTDPILDQGDQYEAAVSSPLQSEPYFEKEGDFIGPLPKLDFRDGKYFPLDSMNTTVQNVRNALSKIEEVGLTHSTGSHSETATGPPGVHAVYALDENPPATKKRRQDSRRRI